eukprot:c14247_g1_i1.p1 GENE.c14247_g1_i1~~c14247_g1_i1.p1  ORF type:complete len:401 (+),score=92.60 c14247_g1_i1:44-1246(+)
MSTPCEHNHDDDQHHHGHSHHQHHHHHHENHENCDHQSNNSNHSTTNTSFRLPTRSILTKNDLERFQHSPTYENFLGFIIRLNDAARGKTLRAECVMSETVSRVIGILDQLEHWIADIAPETATLSRFGNPSFRVWYGRVSENIESMIATVVPTAAALEVSTYLLHSFGDKKRIDYGTGHEANFICFLYCLDKLGVVQQQDMPALTLKVFWRYMRLMRQLQQTYWLEPAGSHGVWGLDDYHFLPFMFGSAQLIDHKYIRPKSIHDADILEQFSQDYMYLACVHFINSVKTGSLRWHSPMIDDISGVKLWAKVNSGMIKMYKVEVLNKLPIMQHFKFGSLIPFEASSVIPSEDEDTSHVHAFGQEFPSCCGIRVPSVFGEAVAEQQKMRNPIGARRPLPFD